MQPQDPGIRTSETHSNVGKPWTQGSSRPLLGLSKAG